MQCKHCTLLICTGNNTPIRWLAGGYRRMTCTSTDNSRNKARLDINIESAWLCFTANIEQLLICVGIPKENNSYNGQTRTSWGGTIAKKPSAGLSSGATCTTTTLLCAGLQYCTLQIVKACVSLPMCVDATPDCTAAHEPSPLSSDQQRGPRHRPA
jgi:hypothetical protein